MSKSSQSLLASPIVAQANGAPRKRQLVFSDFRDREGRRIHFTRKSGGVRVRIAIADRSLALNGRQGRIVMSHELLHSLPADYVTCGEAMRPAEDGRKGRACYDRPACNPFPCARSARPVSRFPFSGSADGTWDCRRPIARRPGLCTAAIDAGITFMDNAWEYNDGAARSAWGRPSPIARSRVPMTKVCTHGRDAKVAMRAARDSLRRLRTDHLDLWQIHEVVYETSPTCISPRAAWSRR